MKVKMLTCLTGGDFVVLPGEYHECDEAEAGRLVEAGLAAHIQEELGGDDQRESAEAGDRETATSTTARRRRTR